MVNIRVLWGNKRVLGVDFENWSDRFAKIEIEFLLSGSLQKKTHHLIKIKIKTTTFFLICGNFLRSWIFLKINLTFTTELLFTTSGFIKIVVTLFKITATLFTFRWTFCRGFINIKRFRFYFSRSILFDHFRRKLFKEHDNSLFTQKSTPKKLNPIKKKYKPTHTHFQPPYYSLTPI